MYAHAGALRLMEGTSSIRSWLLIASWAAVGLMVALGLRLKMQSGYMTISCKEQKYISTDSLMRRGGARLSPDFVGRKFK